MEQLKKRGYFFLFLILFIALVLAGCASSAPAQEIASQKITLYKSQTCGCCALYTKYAMGKGYAVEVKDMQNMASIKEQNQIPQSMTSCHTMMVGDYFVEGHIPLEAVEKMMKEKPDIRGIAMPGMPPGSPGMPGSPSGEFIIYAIKKDGTFAEFMRI